MTPEEYIEKAMKIAENFVITQQDADQLESFLRENLDEIIEAAYDKGLEDRDED
jgi:hypothetical protein